MNCSSWKRGGEYCFLLFSCPSSSLRHNCTHVFLSQTNSSHISFLFLHKFFFFFKFLSRKKELSLFNRGLSKGKSISNRNNKVFKCMHLPVTSQQGYFAKCWMAVICRMNDHQYRTCAVVPQTSFPGKPVEALQSTSCFHRLGHKIYTKIVLQMRVI